MKVGWYDYHRFQRFQLAAQFLVDIQFTLQQGPLHGIDFTLPAKQQRRDPCNHDTAQCEDKQLHDAFSNIIGKLAYRLNYCCCESHRYNTLHNNHQTRQSVQPIGHGSPKLRDYRQTTCRNAPRETALTGLHDISAAESGRIHDAIPDAEERLSWGMPTFWKGRNIIHFAPAKKHIGLYPGPEAIEAFADKLVEYKTSKGAIQLPNDKDLPLELIADIARWSYENNRK